MNMIGWYNQHYKKLLVIPAMLILLSLIYQGYFYQQHQDFLKRDVSLTGGTSLILQTSLSVTEFKEIIGERLGDIDVRALSDNTGQQTHLMILSPLTREELTSTIESTLDITLTEENSSIEFTQGNLGEEFYQQLLTSMLFAFLLMALVVFITFGESKMIKVYATMLTFIALKLTFPTITQISFLALLVIIGGFFYGLYVSTTKQQKLLLLGLLILALLLFFYPFYAVIYLLGILCLFLYTKYSAPSIAVLLSAFADILFTVATVNLLGIKISSGGIVAFLMLIGYSVGTDVLLTTRVLHRRGESVNQACAGAFKTGFVMTLTAIASILVGLLYVYRFETVLNQIFLIILIGLLYDILNTWLTNVLIIKWYAESKEPSRRTP